MSEHEAFDRQKGTKKEAPESKSTSSKLADAVKRTAAQKDRLESMKAPAIKTRHTVVSGDTLSGLAQKYYGSAAREKWMAIYEANKELIGDNPSLIRVGQVLQIPELES